MHTRMTEESRFATSVMKELYLSQRKILMLQQDQKCSSKIPSVCIPYDITGNECNKYRYLSHVY